MAMHETGKTFLEVDSRKPQQTMELGRLLGKVVRPGDCLALSGPLGSGKTMLVRGLAQGMGIDAQAISSPTFILIREHEGRYPLVHIDAYRIQGLSDLESAGWSDELLDGTVTAIEWADRLADFLPGNCLRIDMQHVSQNERKIILKHEPGWSDRLSGIARQLSGSSRPTWQRTCPICKRPVEPDSPAFPFCSNRCRMVDLNRWFNGDYQISRPYEPVDDSPE